ncbi:MAG: hypothetical protein ACOH2F_06785 [Cellulomonas sp.]
MSVPYIYSVTETRIALSHLVTDLADGTHGPVILGPHGRPKATLLAWDLFDEMRDALSTFDVLRAVPTLVERLTHPSGVGTATVGALTGSTSPAKIRFWPDVVPDLRATLTREVAETIDAIATGDLAGEPLEDARLAGEWAWLLVTRATGTDPVMGTYLIWRVDNAELELVAVLPSSEGVTRAWQPAPDPET